MNTVKLFELINRRGFQNTASFLGIHERDLYQRLWRFVENLHNVWDALGEQTAHLEGQNKLPEKYRGEIEEELATMEEEYNAYNGVVQKIRQEHPNVVNFQYATFAGRGMAKRKRMLRTLLDVE